MVWAVELLAITIGVLGLATGLAALWWGHRDAANGGRTGFDPVTGLRDRRSLAADMNTQAGRGADPVAALMIDLDRFGAFLDTNGRSAGDHALRMFGALLERQLRDGDTAYRHGDGSFCVVLPGSDVGAAAAVAERVRRSIATAPLDASGRITASVGVAAGEAGDIVLVLDQADRALAFARDAGRDRISLA